LKFANEKGETKTEFNVGEKFRILIPKQTPAGGFSFSGLVFSSLRSSNTTAF
jgi:hypothetical protein